MTTKKVSKTEYKKSLKNFAKSVAEYIEERGVKAFDALTEDEKNTFSFHAQEIQYMRLARTIFLAEGERIVSGFEVESIKPEVKKLKRVLSHRYY